MSKTSRHFERSATTVRLVEELSRAPVRMSYTELSLVAGCDIQKHRGFLQTALNDVRREKNLVYVTEPKVGIVLAKGGDFAALGKAATASIHRTAKRTVDKMSAAVLDEMTPVEKIAFNATAAGMGAIALVSAPRVVKKLEAAQGKTAERLSLAATLQQFAE